MTKQNFGKIKQLISRVLFVDFPLLLPLARGGAINKNLVLIIPADTGNAGGSLGDIAMLSGLIRELSIKEPDLKYQIIGNTTDSIDIPFFGKAICTPAWIGLRGTLNFLSKVRQCKYILGIGADVLDGKYSDSHTYRFVKYLNYASAKGIKASIIGFSFNSTPNKKSIRDLRKLDNEISIQVRDQFSLERFIGHTHKNALLCADVAFLMPPAPFEINEIENWIHTHPGNFIGLNLNLHALDSIIKKTGIDNFTKKFSDNIIAFAIKTKSSILLIPHDSKKESGDNIILDKIQINISMSSKVETRKLITNDPSVVKRVCSKLDLVISGRMHLAIAALGSGTPVLAIAYQDKFEGLFHHFELGQNLIFSPSESLNYTLFEEAEKLLNNKLSIRNHINTKLPYITSLAMKNIPGNF